MQESHLQYVAIAKLKIKLKIIFFSFYVTVMNWTRYNVESTLVKTSFYQVHEIP